MNTRASNFNLLAGFGLLTTAMVGCVAPEATQPVAVQAANVSAEQYSTYSCNQLRAEYSRAQRISQDMETELKRRADQDQALTDVWIVTGAQLGAFK